jgi:hypothetical protein
MRMNFIKKGMAYKYIKSKLICLDLLVQIQTYRNISNSFYNRYICPRYLKTKKFKEIHN